jgi:hypothetical protein
MTEDYTTQAILAAVDAVNDNVKATRADLSSFRDETVEVLSLHATAIQELKLTKATEKAWVKGLKAPFVLGGIAFVALIDHWEHGKSFVSWITGK